MQKISSRRREDIERHIRINKWAVTEKLSREKGKISERINDQKGKQKQKQKNRKEDKIFKKEYSEETKEIEMKPNEEEMEQWKWEKRKLNIDALFLTFIF